MPTLLTVALLLLIAAPAGATFSYYSDRGVFEAAFPPLVEENFEKGTRTTGLGFDSPLNSMSDNVSFSPGDIVDGVTFANLEPSYGLLFLADDFRFSSKILLQSSESGNGHPIEISFDIPVRAVGFDVYTISSSSGLFPSDVDISLFGASGLLAVRNISTAPGGGPTFFGVGSDLHAIASVVIDAGKPFGVFRKEGIDDVAFLPIPEPSTALLMGLGLAGLAGVRKRVAT